MKPVRFTAAARRDLARHGNVAAKLLQHVREYAEGRGMHANNVTRLKGSEASRLRVGDWRIVFVETATGIDVIKVAPRGGAYD